MSKKKTCFNYNIWTIIETIVVMLMIIAYGLGYYWFMRFIDMSAHAQTRYIQMCFVGGDMAKIPGTFGIEWIFDYMLRILFLFVGNHVVAAFWLQFVIQIIAIFIIYRGMRKIVHPVIAVITMAGVIGTSLYLFTKIPLNSGCIVFLFVSVCFYFVSLLVHKRKNKIAESEESDMKVNITVAVVEDENEVIEVEEVKPEIKFLENPLPGPKKHISKRLDYDLKDEDLVDLPMNYDIDVPDDDDFDI